MIEERRLNPTRGAGWNRRRRWRGGVAHPSHAQQAKQKQSSSSAPPACNCCSKPRVHMQPPRFDRLAPAKQRCNQHVLRRTWAWMRGASTCAACAVRRNSRRRLRRRAANSPSCSRR